MLLEGLSSEIAHTHAAESRLQVLLDHAAVGMPRAAGKVRGAWGRGSQVSGLVLLSHKVPEVHRRADETKPWFMGRSSSSLIFSTSRTAMSAFASLIR